MSDILDHISLSLALKRVKHEISQDRCFGVHPHELKLIKADEDVWLRALSVEISSGTYDPGPLEILQVPKPYGAIRPGGRLRARDHVVYTACVGYYSDKIRERLHWLDRPRDFSHPIAPNPHSYQWMDNPFSGWKKFADKSLEKIAQGAQYVVITDIAGFYENIDIALLLSELRAVDDNAVVLQLLSSCLNKWSLSHVSGRGVPQGFAASDILARLYLNSIDRGLSERGVFHYRYVDDFRLFCESLPEARKALAILILLLRKRGLVLQTAKSGIHNAEEAAGEIQGIQPVLRAILQEYVDDVAKLFGIDDPYFSLWDAEQIILADADEAPLEIIRVAYEKYFVTGQPSAFDKTLFHFLLKRLRNRRDSAAFPHCLTFLTSQPQETSAVLKYVSGIGMVMAAELPIVAFLESTANVYWYQVHQIVAWRTTLEAPVADEVIAYVRRMAFESRAPGYVKAAGREFLARFGTAADIDRLEEHLAEAANDLERAEVICSIRRMETGRRNAILARLTTESQFAANAVRLVRSNGLD